jgi:lipoic acid synthetase
VFYVKREQDAPMRKPEWLRINVPSGNNYVKVKQTLSRWSLHTVCEEARCPNVAECWGGGTATIMIMGDLCTRHCRFCAVKSRFKSDPLDHTEPFRTAKAIKEWGLRYVVITSVCRDDIEDGGAGHVSSTVRAMKKICPKTIIETLIPDFQGNASFLEKIVSSKPEVISHNIETVSRLTPKVRDGRASYNQSLQVLKKIKELDSKIFTKSSIMLGIGETDDEVVQSAHDLRSVGVDIITIGQYLQPTAKHLPVVQYLTPERFRWFKEVTEQMGFKYVAAGPLVRSSFRAGELFLDNVIGSRECES